MGRLLQPLLLLLATATDKALARHVQYLKAENQILRSRLPKRLVVTPREQQRLLRFGKPLGSAIRQLITIDTPRTFLRWLHGEAGACRHSSRRRPGRPRTPQEIRELILRLARETGWGYLRILGELKKLGISSVSRSTVRNLLRQEGWSPVRGAARARGTPS